jgi:hypothetical protein
MIHTRITLTYGRLVWAEKGGRDRKERGLITDLFREEH